MHWTRTLIPTLKESPDEPPGVGRRLLVRAGMLRTGDSAHFALLPLGHKTLSKVVGALREQLAATGWTEILLVGEGMLRELLATTISSYKQLPLLVHQIETAGNSPAVRGFGFETGDEARGEILWRLRPLVFVLHRAGVTPIIATANFGNAVLYRTDSGTDELVASDRGNYFATAGAATTGSRPWSLAGEPIGQLEKVHTPGASSIESVCAFLQIAPRQILKTLVFQAKSPIPVNWVVAVVRGDHQVNQRKLARAAEAMGVTHIELVDSPKVRQKFAIGFVGPDAGTKVPDAVLVVDPDAAQGVRPWAAGANETDFHVKNFNWFRDCGDRLADPTKTLVADIRNALPGDPSPLDDGGTLRIEPALELARISENADAFGATFDDETGRKRPVLAMSFRFDLLAFMTAVAESNHDEHGIRWPAGLAPCSAVVTPIKYEGAVKEAADKLYTQLTFEGIDTILDDRDARAGFKFADADLIGFPIRINVGDKHLAAGNVEIKLRVTAQVSLCPLADVPARVRGLLADLRASSVSPSPAK